MEESNKGGFYLDQGAVPLPGPFNFAARVAVHPDGTVYGAYYRTNVQPGTNPTPQVMQADVIMVRDDHFAASEPGFGALRDPDNPNSGRIVISGINIPFFNGHLADFGQERLVGGDISIAIDPGNSRRVYLAYAEGTGPRIHYPERTGPVDYTIHVMVSSDGGQTWSDDLRTVAKAKNFSLAVNRASLVTGDVPETRLVGFFYQQFQPGDDPRWVTTFEVTSNDWQDFDKLILANTPAMTPAAAAVFPQYLADYANLVTLGSDFLGIFAANNTPDPSNFPSGVSYQRNVDFQSQELLDGDQNVVPPSIDPFFFRIYESDRNLAPGLPQRPPAPPVQGPVIPAPGDPVE